MSKVAKIRPIRDNIYFFDKETNEKKSKYDKVSRDLRHSLQAGNPEKSLSIKARILATNYYSMINNSENGVIFVSHDFISDITEVGHSQNKRYHNQLRDLFNIQYHQSIIIDGKKYRDGFSIQFTENTEIILKNPKLFYSSQESKNEQLSVQKGTPRCSKKDAPLYIYKEKPINKPIESSYIANGSMNFENENFTENSPVEKPQEAKQANSLNKKFVLKDFYPLTQEDASNLRSLSGRTFELLPMNEILLKIHNYTEAKGAKVELNDKEHFLNYFAKRLASEKRDAYKINNVSFRINANITPEEKEAKARNKYLEQMENSGEPFKRFIASRLSERKAYDFLTGFRSLDIKDGTVKIHLSKHVELSETDLNLILQEVQRTHGKKDGSFADGIAKMLNPDPKDQIDKIELITPNSTNQVKEMSDIKKQILTSFGDVRGQEILKICSVNQRSDKDIQVQIKPGESLPEHDKHLLRQCIHKIFGEGVEIHTNKPKETNVIRWGTGEEKETKQVDYWLHRKNLYSHKFKEGILRCLQSEDKLKYLFETYFDKLNVYPRDQENLLILTGDDFYINYISEHYSSLLEKVAKEQKITITLAYYNKATFSIEDGTDPARKPIIFKPTSWRKS